MRTPIRFFAPLLLIASMFTTNAVAQCIPPTGTAVNVDDCTALTFTVDVDVTSLGDAFSVNLIYTVNGGTIQTMTGLGVGIYSLGPFTWGDMIDIIMEHDVDPACNVAFNTVTNGFCPVTVTAPYCESFDSYTGSTCGTCTTLNPDIGNGGWQNTTVHHWQTCAGPTTSGTTGPSVDNTGGGNFIYTESSGACSPADVMIVQSPSIDITALTTPYFTCFYHMFGGDLAGASILVEVEDPSGSGFWSPLTTITESTPDGIDQWQFKGEFLSVFGPEITLRFTGTTGAGFESDMGLDDICVVEAPNCTAPVATYTVIDDCANCTYTVDVDLTSLGDAADVDLMSDLLGTEIAGVTSTGIYTMGPYFIGDPNVVITVQHNGQPIFCSIDQALFTSCPNAFCPLTVTAPHCEDFDSYVGSTCGTCTALNTDFNSGGWQNINLHHWQTCAGPTTSGNTGPASDNTGAGNFIYTETSAACSPADTMIVQGPNYDITALTAPHLTLWYHMFGGDLAGASITIEMEDPAGSGSWNVLDVITETAVDGVNAWQFYNTTLGSVTGPEVALRYTAVTGTGFESDMAMDDICVVEGPNCTPPTASVTVVDDCANCSYTVQVDITSLGDAADLDLISDLLGVEQAAVAATGVYTMGPYLITDPNVNITVQHNGQPIFCSWDTTVTTGCSANYCQGGPTSTADSQVESVVLNGNTQSINLTGNCPGTLGVQNLLCTQVADVYQGLNYSVTIDFGTCGGNFNSIGEAWIDYDQNGVFDPAESLGLAGPAAPAGQVTWMFNVPATAIVGNTVMRVMQQETGIMPLDPCATYTFGSMTDFGIIVDPNPGCFPAFATAVSALDCTTGDMLINVDITDLGDATTVDIATGLNGAPPAVVQTGITAIGSFQLGPFATTDTVQVIVVHTGNNLCNLNLGQVVYTPVICVICGTNPIQDSLCYGNNVDLTWNYQSSTAAPLALIFNAGMIEAFDVLSIYDGPDDSYPLVYQNPAGVATNLTNLLVTSSGNTLTMTLTSNGFGSCAGGTSAQWNWTVDCLDCTVPGGSFNIVADCIHREFTVEVDVDSTGSAATAHIVNSVNTDTIFNVGVGTTTAGPFSMDTAAVVSLLNADNTLCRIFSSPLISLSDSCVIQGCGSDFYTYCYENNDEAWYTYQSTAGNPMALTFIAGDMLVNDRIIVYNGFDDQSAVIFNGNNGGNLTGLSVNSANLDSVITLRILSDPTGSCDDATAAEELHWWVACSQVGVDELASGTDIHLYPNPATEQLFVSIPSENLTVIAQVFDATGRNVLSEQLTFNGAAQPIDLAGLQSGNYFLRIVTDEWVKSELFQIAR